MQQHGLKQKAKTRRRVMLWLLSIGIAVAPLTAQSSGTAALNVPWTPLAPQSLTAAATGSAGGRVLSVAVDPGDASGNTIYIGANGGVFKSTNAAAASGVTFVPVTDLVPAVDIAQTHINLVNAGAVTVQPGRTGVVLAGTGDPTDEADSLYGTGILRSADGGNSWSTITGSRDPATGLEQNSFFGEAFEGFAWSTRSPNTVVAAVTTAPGAYKANAGYTGTGDSSASGLYFSVDAGQTWQLATVEDGPQSSAAGAGTESRSGGAGGGLESGAADLRGRAAQPRLLHVAGWGDVDTASESARTRAEHPGVPVPGIGELPDL